MAGFKRYRKDDPVSYSLGITLTFELLRYKTEYVNKVYVHSAMKEGETYDKLRRICGEAGIPIQQTDKIFHVLSQKENCYVIGEFRKFEDVLDPRASHIVLVNPSNAGNMGTIMRSALGFELNQMAIIRRQLMRLIRRWSAHPWERSSPHNFSISTASTNIWSSSGRENYIRLCCRQRSLCRRLVHPEHTR